MVTNNLPPELNVGGHFISLTLIVLSLIGALPTIAAIVAIIWYCLQIYETETVQHLLHPRHPEKRVHSRRHNNAHRNGHPPRFGQD